MQRDARGYRIAVLDEALANPAADGFDVLAVLERAQWGAIVMPPSWYPDEVSADLIEQSAEHIEEFVRHGYDVICVGSCERLAEPLAKLGLGMPDALKPTSEAELAAFLRRRQGDCFQSPPMPAGP